MGITKDPRREKINELKSTIELAKAELSLYSFEFRQFVKQEVDGDEAKEQRKKDIQERSKIMSQKQAVLEGLMEELKLTRMNKNSSKFFEWHPSPPNRRMRRALQKRI